MEEKGQTLAVIGLVVALLSFFFGGVAGVFSFIGTLLTMIVVLAVVAGILFGIWRLVYGIWCLVYWIGEKIAETCQWLWRCSIAGVSWCTTRMETAWRACRRQFSC